MDQKEEQSDCVPFDILQPLDKLQWKALNKKGESVHNKYHRLQPDKQRPPTSIDTIIN